MGDRLAQACIVVPALFEQEPHLADQPLDFSLVHLFLGPGPDQFVGCERIDLPGDRIAFVRERLEPLQIG